MVVPTRDSITCSVENVDSTSLFREIHQHVWIALTNGMDVLLAEHMVTDAELVCPPMCMKELTLIQFADHATTI